MYVNSVNVGKFNTLNFVDPNGNRLEIQSITGNSGYGMTNLSQGKIVSVAIKIPTGATQLSVIPVLQKNGIDMINGKGGLITINILRPSLPKQAVISTTPSNFTLNESYPEQIVTVTNNGTGTATNILARVSSDLYIDMNKSTCKDTLIPMSNCIYVVKFDVNSNAMGNGSFVVNYATGNRNAPQSSSSSNIEYKGRSATASLLITSSDNPNFNFVSQTKSPMQTSTIELVNNGVFTIQNFHVENLPAYFALSAASGDVQCLSINSLQPNESCVMNITYNNSQVIDNTTGIVSVIYNYDDPRLGNVTKHSDIALSYQTVTSQAVLMYNQSSVDFGVLYNNGIESLTKLVIVTNSGIEDASNVNLNATNLYSIVSSKTTCASFLLAGESCIVAIKSGAYGSNYPTGIRSGSLVINYSPFNAAPLLTNSLSLVTQIVAPRTAIIEVTKSGFSGFDGGNGEFSNSPYQLSASTIGSVTYTVTNRGSVSADSFTISNLTNLSSGWSITRDNCQNVTLAANGGNCTLTFQLNQPAVIGSANLSFSGIQMNWIYEASPSGQTQEFMHGSLLYANVYTPAQITFNSNVLTLSANSTANLTVSLSGGYNVTGQTISFKNNISNIISTINSSPAPCTLSSTMTSCTFNLTATANARYGVYSLEVTNSGSVVTPSSLTITIAPAFTWVNGSKLTNRNGNYGVLGIASTANAPGARVSGVSWTDSNGNMWLFGGGLGYAASGGVGYLNDLWKYNSVTNQWAWISGSNLTNQYGNYGDQGTSGINNMLGARMGSISWLDNSGNLWLFGGSGYAMSGISGSLNDLWKYNPTTNEWVWVNGSFNTSANGVYGTQGVANTNNVPGARSGSISWRDNSGNLWLFGGFGVSATSGTNGELNDLWKYNPNTNQWTWVSGSNTISANGVYGIQGVASSANMPGSRQDAVSWVDNSNNLWLFGGSGYGSNCNGYLNDLWKYNPSTNQWIWVSGSNLCNQMGTYGVQTVPLVTNQPGARSNSLSWVDQTGKFWLFGGIGNASNWNFGSLNDVWIYDPSINQWIWETGSSLSNQYGNYGTLGISAISNVPGGRCCSNGWVDNSNNLWLFGGNGYSSTAQGSLNDLWRLDIGN